MMHKNRSLACCSLSALALLAAIAVAAPPLGLTPREGLLLLRNGEVLRGKVARVGEHFQVTLPDGEIRVKPEDAEFFCQDLDEGYRLKREALGGTAEEHLRLAEWCLKHNLQGDAARELADAIAVDPQQPGIRALSRRLELARQAPREEEPLVAPQASVATEDLDQLVASLPPNAVEMFTDRVQPLLVNHCGSAGCHGHTSGAGFRLLRMPGKGLPSRRLTQRNLHAAISALDREDFANSPLLVKSLEPHGEMTTPVFAGSDALKYRQIAAWARYAASPARPRPESLSDNRRPLRNMRAIGRPGEEAARGEEKVADEAGAAEVTDDELSADAEPQDGAAESSTARGDRPDDLHLPADPFDPAPFNERFFPQDEDESEASGE